MKAQIIIDKDTYDKFRSFEKILNTLDGRINIELLSTFNTSVGYSLSEFIVHDSHDATIAIKKRLDEAIEEKIRAIGKLDNVHYYFWHGGDKKVRCSEIKDNWENITSGS